MVDLYLCIFSTVFSPVGGSVNWSHFCLCLCLCLCLRPSAWPNVGASREVVSKSMLGQLEQYEIVKGQIRQQYYSSIEEKVKNDWYKTINIRANDFTGECIGWYWLILGGTGSV